jgi:hypothetical protein
MAKTLKSEALRLDRQRTSAIEHAKTHLGEAHRIEVWDQVKGGMGLAFCLLAEGVEKFEIELGPYSTLDFRILRLRDNRE